MKKIAVAILISTSSVICGSSWWNESVNHFKEVIHSIRGGRYEKYWKASNAIALEEVLNSNKTLAKLAREKTQDLSNPLHAWVNENIHEDELVYLNLPKDDVEEAKWDIAIFIVILNDKGRREFARKVAELKEIKVDKLQDITIEMLKEQEEILSNVNFTNWKKGLSLLKDHSDALLYIDETGKIARFSPNMEDAFVNLFVNINEGTSEKLSRADPYLLELINHLDIRMQAAMTGFIRSANDDISNKLIKELQNFYIDQKIESIDKWALSATLRFVLAETALKNQAKFSKEVNKKIEEVTQFYAFPGNWSEEI